MVELVSNLGTAMNVVDAATELFDSYAQTDRRTGHTAATVRTNLALYRFDRGAVDKSIRVETIVLDDQGNVREGIWGQPPIDSPEDLAKAQPISLATYRRAREIAFPGYSDNTKLGRPIIEAGKRLRARGRVIWRKVTLAA